MQTAKDFLHCATPDRWLENALNNPVLLLLDHANCEKKAASSALHLIYRCTDNADVMESMSKLVEIEMGNFQELLMVIRARNLDLIPLSASRYAAGLRDQMASGEKSKLIDLLIIGAFMHGRAYERFSSLIPYIDAELERFYRSFIKTQESHFRAYFSLAKSMSDETSFMERVRFFGFHEKILIELPDTEFRVYSGPVN
jgi:tRNA-(ms[2]io[6]A)-hydroxylase